jgi:hypothetical protein
MTTRAERQRERIARLLDQAMAAAEVWAQREYDTGVEDGRHGPVHMARQRDVAERRYRDIAAKLAAAVTPPPDSGKGQHRLPLP